MEMKLHLSTVFVKALVFSVSFTFLFLLAALLTNDQAFISNGFTEGSDDLAYLTSVQNALAGVNLSINDLFDLLVAQTQHAPAYPIILYFLLAVLPGGVFAAIFLNNYLLYLTARIAVRQTNVIWVQRFPVIFILLFMPGMLFVSWHAYKDMALSLITLASLVAFVDKRYIFAAALVFLTGFFRPFNGVLIVISWILCFKFRWVIAFAFFLLISSQFLLPIIDLNSIEYSLHAAQEIALRDMESYGSSYQPSGDFIVDYLFGLIRFTLLPFPWSVSWVGRPAFYSLLEMSQSIVIWCAAVCSIVSPRKVMDVIRKNSILFWYTFLQASVYAVIYFGNGQARYRVFIFIVSALVLISVLQDWVRNLSKAILPLRLES